MVLKPGQTEVVQTIPFYQGKFGGAVIPKIGQLLQVETAVYCPSKVTGELNPWKVTNLSIAEKIAKEGQLIVVNMSACL